MEKGDSDNSRRTAKLKSEEPYIAAIEKKSFKNNPEK